MVIEDLSARGGEWVVKAEENWGDENRGGGKEK